MDDSDCNGQHDAGPTPSSAEHERAARIDQETARAQKEAADAQRSTAEVQRDIERDKLRQAKFAYKQAKRENRGQFLKLLYRVPKLVWLVLAVALIGGAVYASIVSTSSAPVETSFSSQLTKIVDVSRLATARFAYEGIAEKKNEKKETEYRVFYRAEVEASVEMSQIDFSNIDDETKTVYPVLPEISWDCGRFPVHPTPAGVETRGTRRESSTPAPARSSPSGTTASRSPGPP